MVDTRSGVGMVGVARIVAAASAIATLAVAGCGDSTSPSTPTHLTFVVEPNAVGVASAIAPAVVVAVMDDAELTVWSWTDTVRLSLRSEDGSATLLGTTSVIPTSGTAVFEDLRVDGVGAGYRLVATSAALADGVSQPFTVHDVFLSSTVAAGGYHTCALLADGAAYCWGSNRSGELGDGTEDNRSVPTSVSTMLPFVTLTVAESHTCGLTSDGAAYCWGASGGMIGDGTTESRSTPTPVAGGLDFTAISAGDYHTCGITTDGTAYCWGANSYGMIGDGTTEDRSTPTPVAGDLTFTAISAGFLHTCGIAADGAAYCWGANYYGEVGDGTWNPGGQTDHRPEPTAVLGGHRFVSLTTGGVHCHGSTCGITTDGATLCWGRSYQTSGVRLTEPTAIEGDPGFVFVDPGSSHACGIATDATLHCWGTNSVPTPTPILPDSSFASVSLGATHTCAVTTNGATFCWGRNDYGQLGNGSSLAGWAIPVPVWRP